MPYIIKLDAIKAEALADLEKVAKKFEDIAEAQKKARDVMKVPSGPYQRLDAAQRRMDAIKSLGDKVPGAVVSDAALHLERAQTAVYRAQGIGAKPPKIPDGDKSPQQQFKDAMIDLIGTTRVNIGPNGAPQFMPLINRGISTLARLPAVGEAAAALGMTAGGLAAVATGAAAALYAVAQMAAIGADKLAKLGTAAIIAGGYGGQAGALAGRGRLAGLGADDVSGIAIKFGEELRKGGIGSAFFRSQGIVDYGPYTVNKMTNLEKALDALSHVTDRNTRIMIARDAGLEAFLPFLESSAGLRQLGRATSKGYNESDAQFGRDYQATKGVIGNAFDFLHSRMAEQFMSPLVEGLNALGSIGTGDWRQMGRGAARALSSQLSFATGGFWGLDSFTGFRDWRNRSIDRLFGTGQKAPDDERTNSLRDNTRALRENTDWIKAGNRAMNSVPRNWKQVMMEEGLRTQAANLGAFQ